MIDARSNESSGWIVESIESQYINISTCRPLSGLSYMNVPVELRSSWKGLITVKNKDQKCFLWCHVRHVNPSKKYPERIKKTDKNIAEKLNYDGIEFPVQKNILAILKKRTTFVLMCLVMKMSWFFQFTFQIKNLKTQRICCF